MQLGVRAVLADVRHHQPRLPCRPVGVSGPLDELDVPPVLRRRAGRCCRSCRRNFGALPGSWFHSLQATSQALQPMQSVVSVKKPRCAPWPALLSEPHEVRHDLGESALLACRGRAAAPPARRPPGRARAPRRRSTVIRYRRQLSHASTRRCGSRSASARIGSLSVDLLSPHAGRSCARWIHSSAAAAAREPPRRRHQQLARARRNTRAGAARRSAGSRLGSPPRQAPPAPGPSASSTGADGRPSQVVVDRRLALARRAIGPPRLEPARQTARERGLARAGVGPAATVASTTSGHHPLDDVAREAGRRRAGPSSARRNARSWRRAAPVEAQQLGGERPVALQLSRAPPARCPSARDGG